MNPPQTTAPLLALLAEKIHEQNFTEPGVDEALGWDAGHVRQLTAGLERPHVDEVLQILGAIDVDPRAFFAELYGTPPVAALQDELEELKAMIDSVANLLVENRVVTAGELMRAVAARAGDDPLETAEP